MTSATVETRTRGSNEAGLALVGYFLLSLSVFMAGFPALAAVVIAYWRRDRVEPAVRDHFNRQIVIFWIAALLLLIAMALAIAAIAVAAGHLVQVGRQAGWTTFSIHASNLIVLDSDLGRLSLATPVAGLAAGALGAWVCAGLWLFVAPIFGAIALARSPLIGNRGR